VIAQTNASRALYMTLQFFERSFQREHNTQQPGMVKSLKGAYRAFTRGRETLPDLELSSDKFEGVSMLSGTKLEWREREDQERTGSWQNYKARKDGSFLLGDSLQPCEGIDPGLYKHEIVADERAQPFIASTEVRKAEMVLYNYDYLNKTCRPFFPTARSKCGKRVFAKQREILPAGFLSDRIESFGALGKAMHKNLLSKRLLTRAVGLYEQRDEIERLEKTDVFLAACYSLLYAELPIQIASNDALFDLLAELSFTASALRPKHEDVAHEKELKLFPPKKHPSVENKTNVYFSEVYESALRIDKHICDEFATFAGHIKGRPNDQAAACLMYAVVLSQSGFKDATRIAMSAIIKPEEGSALSTAIKSLGIQCVLKGAVLVETGAMQGRGIGEINLKEVMQPRTQPNGETELAVDQNILSLKIKEILDDEMELSAYSYEEPLEFWTRRWEWGVNGSHSRLLQKYEPRWTVAPEGLKRLHRRVYLEEVDGNPIDDWSGDVYVSCIKKIENEKERDLQSIDSNTYVNFEHMISGVERCWKGKRVILNPGEGGTIGIAERVRALQAKVTGSYNVMIDYAKYNTQHSLASQMNVVGLVCEKIGYPAGMSRRLVDSFRKMKLFHDGEYLGLAQWSLLSGHRLTTFINSVLNLAYLKVFCPAIDECGSMHVGDDVYVAAGSLEPAVRLALQLRDSPILAKEQKQSLGNKSAEFLRMCTSGDVTRGYVCRTIATCIMGNWVNDIRVSPMEGLQNMVEAAWTLGNRAQNPELGRLVYSSVCRLTGLPGKVVADLVTGKAGLNDGPQRYYNMLRTYYKVEFIGTVNHTKKGRFKAKAVKEFCENHITPLELRAIELSGASVAGAMLDASYMKSVIDVSNMKERQSMLVAWNVEKRGIYNSVWLRDILHNRKVDGLLSQYPIMQLIKNQLDSWTLRVILSEITNGQTDRLSDEMLYVAAWGARAQGCVINGYLPYSDAARLSGATDRHMVTCEITVAA
jgi:hypothetical protein